MPTVLELHREVFSLAGHIDDLPKGSQIRAKMEEKHRGLWIDIAEAEGEILLKNRNACVFELKEVCDEITKGRICLRCLRTCKCGSQEWWFRNTGEIVCGSCHPKP